jgi:hypothetical protein
MLASIAPASNMFSVRAPRDDIAGTLRGDAGMKTMTYHTVPQANLLPSILP